MRVVDAFVEDPAFRPSDSMAPNPTWARAGDSETRPEAALASPCARSSPRRLLVSDQAADFDAQ